MDAELQSNGEIHNPGVRSTTFKNRARLSSFPNIVVTPNSMGVPMLPCTCFHFTLQASLDTMDHQQATIRWFQCFNLPHVSEQAEQCAACLKKTLADILLSFMDLTLLSLVKINTDVLDISIYSFNF